MLADILVHALIAAALAIAFGCIGIGGTDTGLPASENLP